MSIALVVVEPQSVATMTFMFASLLTAASGFTCSINSSLAVRRFAVAGFYSGNPGSLAELPIVQFIFEIIDKESYAFPLFERRLAQHEERVVRENADERLKHHHDLACEKVHRAER